MKKHLFLISALLLLLAAVAAAKDDSKPGATVRPKTGATAADPTGFSHKVGALWTQITNYGFYGDRAYAEPNFEWPGGSGNIYGWLTSIWIGGVVDSLGYISYGEGNHFTPLDSIHVRHAADGSLSAEDTYTRYTDVDPPSASGVHKNLGVEVTERTYAWDQSYNDDFIICDYWIKYVLRDLNGDGVITSFDSTLTGVYVGFRMDADVSGFLGTSTDTYLWDRDDQVGYDAANKLIYLYDGDSPNIAGNDVGNPDPVDTLVLRSPGYIGARMLYYDSTHFVGTYTGLPTMATPSWRNSEPVTSQAMYEYLKGKGISPNSTTPLDYRGIFGAGPFVIPQGDSIHVVIAWVIGNGLQGITKNSQVAQAMYDGNYSRAPAAPAVPQLTISPTTVGGVACNALRWKNNAESSLDPLTNARDFAGYAVYRTSRSSTSGDPIWDTLAVYVLNNAVDPVKDSIWYGRPFLKSWPPTTVVQGSDTLYELIDPNTPNGLIYTYAVTAFDGGDSLLGIGRLENQIGRGRVSTQVYMPNSPAAANAGRVRVVPNPFMGSSRFNNPNPVDTNPWVNRLRFINLPRNATISIFTLAGDLVKTIHSGDIVYQSRDVAVTGDFSGVAEWDLTTRNNQEAVSGLYIYVVESPSGSSTGKFVIMR